MDRSQTVQNTQSQLNPDTPIQSVEPRTPPQTKDSVQEMLRHTLGNFPQQPCLSSAATTNRNLRDITMDSDNVAGKNLQKLFPELQQKWQQKQAQIQGDVETDKGGQEPRTRIGVLRFNALQEDEEAIDLGSFINWDAPDVKARNLDPAIFRFRNWGELKANFKENPMYFTVILQHLVGEHEYLLGALENEGRLSDTWLRESERSNQRAEHWEKQARALHERAKERQQEFVEVTEENEALVDDFNKLLEKKNGLQSQVDTQGETITNLKYDLAKSRTELRQQRQSTPIRNDRTQTEELENLYHVAPSNNKPMQGFGGSAAGVFGVDQPARDRQRLDASLDDKTRFRGRKQNSYVPPSRPTATQNQYGYGSDEGRYRDGTTPRTEATTTIRPPRQTTGHPDKFDGTDKSLFKSWIFSVTNKLALDEDYFNYIGNEKTVGYIVSLVKGDAFEGIAHRVPQKGRVVNNPFMEPMELLEYLHKVYGEHDQVSKHQEDFRNLKQGDMDFSEFFVKFDRLATLLLIPKEMRANDLKYKLNDRYRNRIINMRTRDYDDLVEALQALKYDMHIYDSARAARKQEKQVSGTHTTGTRRSYRERNAASSSASTAPAATAKGKTLTRADLPNKFRDIRALLSVEEKSRYEAERRCWTCGEQGHNSRSPRCPLKDFKSMLRKEREALQANVVDLESDEDYTNQYSDDQLRHPDYSSDDESGEEEF